MESQSLNSYHFHPYLSLTQSIMHHTMLCILYGCVPHFVFSADVLGVYRLTCTYIQSVLYVIPNPQTPLPAIIVAVTQAALWSRKVNILWKTLTPLIKLAVTIHHKKMTWKKRDIFRFIGKGSFRALLGFSLWLQCKSKQFLWSAEKIRGTLVLFTAGLIINHKFLIHPAGAFVLFFKLRSSTSPWSLRILLSILGVPRTPLFWIKISNVVPRICWNPSLVWGVCVCVGGGSTWCFTSFSSSLFLMFLSLWLYSSACSSLLLAISHKVNMQNN